MLKYCALGYSACAVNEQLEEIGSVIWGKTERKMISDFIHYCFSWSPSSP